MCAFADLSTDAQHRSLDLFGSTITDFSIYRPLFPGIIDDAAFYRMVGKITLGSRIDETGCLLYLPGADTKDGYGLIYAPGCGQMLAHRVAFILHHRVKLGLATVDHLCQFHRCIAKAHLHPRSRAEHGRETRRRHHWLDNGIARWLDDFVSFDSRAAESTALLRQSWVAFCAANRLYPGDVRLFFQRLLHVSRSRGCPLKRLYVGTRTYRHYAYQGIRLLPEPFNPGAADTERAVEAMAIRVP